MLRAALRRGRIARVACWAGGCALLLPAAVVVTLGFVPPPITSLTLIRAAQGMRPHAVWLQLDAIGADTRHAAILAEDWHFCSERFGFDFAAIGAQMRAWREGQRPTGASTIAMQTARSLFLWPGRGMLRKAIEVWLAPQLALLWPHRRLLEVYLNVAEFGPALIGIEAASRQYFGKSAATLTAEEALRLILLLPDPAHRRPDQLPPDVAARATMLRQMLPGLAPTIACAD